MPEPVTYHIDYVVFLTVNHHGTLPFMELHFTGETKLWRDPWGSWACLQPVSDYEWMHSPRVCDTDMWSICRPGHFSYNKSPQTPPPEVISLHHWNTTVYDLFHTTSDFALPETDRQVSSLKSRVFFFFFFFFPLFYSTSKICVLRDPWGSWACLWLVFDHQRLSHKNVA